MEQNVFMLLATIVCGIFAVFFAIIGVATDGWRNPFNDNKTQLFPWGNQLEHNYTATGILLIISIVMTAIATLCTIMFLLEFINNSANRIKAFVLFLFVLSGILIAAAYSRAVATRFYSYHMSVTAGTLTFLSMIFFTYWIGYNSAPRAT